MLLSFTIPLHKSNIHWVPISPVACHFCYQPRQSWGFMPFHLLQCCSHFVHPDTICLTVLRKLTPLVLQCIKKLPRVQNNAAQIVLKAPRQSHASQLLRTLHWLPVQQRIDYVSGSADIQVCSTSTPLYLCCLIQDQQHNHNLWSATTTVSTFHNLDFCEAHLPMLCSSCLELTTEHCH